MRTSFKAIGAAGIAAATLVSGLSFGTAAATATTSTPGITATESMPFVLSGGGSFWAMAKTGNAVHFIEYSSRTEAVANARTFDVSSDSWSTLTWKYGQYTNCLGVSSRKIIIATSTCNASSDLSHFKLVNGQLVNKANQELHIDGFQASEGRQYAHYGTGATEYSLSQLGAQVASVDVPGRSAVLKGTAEPGADLIINDTIPAEADGDGRWSKQLTGLKLGKQTVKVEQWKDGNRIGEPITVEVDLAIAPLTVKNTFSDNTNERVHLSGTADKAADVVIRTPEQQTYVAPVGTDGVWEYALPAPNKAGDYTVTVTQRLAKTGGGSDETTPVEHTINYGAGISITSPEKDSDFPGGPLEMSGRGQVGATVSVTEKGSTKELATGSVMGNNIWSVTTEDLTPGKHTLVVSQQSKGQNTTTAEVTVNPGASTIADPTGTVTFDENDMSRKATVAGTGVDGATITLFNGAERIGTATVRNGTWSTQIDPIGPGEQSIRIEQSGIEGVQTATTTADYGQAATIGSPTAGKITPGMVTVEGTGQTGARMTVKAGGKTATTTVVDGVYSTEIEIPASTEATLITVEQHSKGNLRTTTDVQVTGDGDQQLLPVVINGPATYANGKSIEVTGTATPYATVDIATQWNTIKTVTADKNGNWSFWRGFGPNVIYTLTATQTLSDRQTSTSEAFTLLPIPSQTAPVAIAGPIDGYNATGGTRVHGIASPGATVKVSSQWGTLTTVTANNNGVWEFYRGFGPNITYTLTAEQTRTDNTTSTSAPFTLTPKQ